MPEKHRKPPIGPKIRRRTRKRKAPEVVAAEDGDRLIGAPQKVTGRIVVATLIKTRGHVQMAARALGVNQKTIYRRVGRARIEQIRAEALEQDLDFAETKLQTMIRDGDWRALRFFLLTKGKHRGYQFGRKDEVQSVTISATLSEVLAELEKRENWDEIARTTVANRHSGLLGDGGQPAREVGHGAVVTGSASAVDRPGDDGEPEGAPTQPVPKSAHHRSAAASRKK